MLKEPVYECANFFLTRFALLPHEEISLSAEWLFDFYENTPLFQEAIAIASPSLHESLQTLSCHKGNKDKLYPSLLKYYLRMSTRATPFGLFSGIGWGEFREKTDLSLSFSSLSKKAKPDSEWIQQLVDTLHSKREWVRHLKVMTNPKLLKKSGRIFLRKKNSTTEAHEFISIKSTNTSDYIFSLAITPILYSELEKRFTTHFENYPEEAIQDYLWKIFQQNYLLSECTPNLNHPFSLTEFQNKINRIECADCFPRLDSLHNIITKYEEASFVNAISEFEEVINELNIWKVKYPVHLDTYRKSGEFYLSESVKEAVNNAASILWYFSAEAHHATDIQGYLKLFKEKYGTSRLVPILELIDPHRGIGIPELPHSQESLSSSSWQTILYSHLNDCEIRLDSHINFEISPTQLQKAPPSLELFFDLIATSQEDIEKGKFTLVVNPTVMTNQAGSAFGRFLHLCTPSQVDQLREFIKKEENLYPDVIFVEASFLPDNARTVNVAHHEKIRNFQLQLHFHEMTDHNIQIEDIYVGASLDGLYLYSKKMNKEIYITLSSAVNSMQAPPILDLLLKISKSRFIPLSSFPWKGVYTQPYLPRICYKNIILSPARWFINETQMSVEQKSSHDIECFLEQTLTKYQVPYDIFLCYFDNRILINWKNRDHFRLLVQQFVKRKEICLFESIGNGKQEIARSEWGKHCLEFVVPCIKWDKHKTPRYVLKYPSTCQISLENRHYHPGSEWLYIKFYMNTENEQLFLVKQIAQLMDKLISIQYLTKWFYVRYNEIKPHLRVRLHGNPQQICQNVIPIICQQTAEWKMDGVLSDYSFHTYEREIERYGGPSGIDFSEEIFYLDSQSCLLLFEAEKHLDLSLDVIGAFGIINILRGFISGVGDQLKFLSTAKEHASLLNGMRSQTKTALKYLVALMCDNRDIPPALQIVRDHFDKIVSAIRQLQRTFDQSQGDMWSSKEHLIHSFIHMHCNRLLGINSESEKKARMIAYHLLEKMLFISKQKEELRTQ